MAYKETFSDQNVIGSDRSHLEVVWRTLHSGKCKHNPMILVVAKRSRQQCPKFFLRKKTRAKNNNEINKRGKNQD